MSAALVPIETLGAEIKARVEAGDRALDKAEQHYIAAGIQLAEAKKRLEQTGEMRWSAFLFSHARIKRRRADDLIAIGEGRITLAEHRERNRERVAAHRERKRAEGKALRNAEPIKVASVLPAQIPHPDADAREEGIQWLEDKLKAAYYSVAETYRAFGGDSSPKINRMREEAIARFESEELFFSDFVKMVEVCAFERLNDFFGSPDTTTPMSWRKHSEDLKMRAEARAA